MARYQRTGIPPFPPDIDRQHFASYLSGLTDGEGTFALHYRDRTDKSYNFCHLAFAITLRADDKAVLQLTQSFFGCGTLILTKRNHIGKTKPAWRLCVQGIPDLTHTVVPHFRRHPLFAKKKRDFDIWQEGVALAYRVWKRPRHNGGRGARGCGGGFPKWTVGERGQFKALCAAIMEQRIYQANTVHIPPPRPEPPSLFDGLP